MGILVLLLVIGAAAGVCMSLQCVGVEVVNGNDAVTMIRGGDFILKLMAKRKDGRYITREVPFGVASNTAVGVTEADVEQAASVLAARIAKLSEGVICGLYRKLGKYRNDEVPSVISCQVSQWGSIIVSNNPQVEDPESIETPPKETRSFKLFVPWLDDATSRQDMKATLNQAITVGAAEFRPAVSRFLDEEKTEVAYYPLEYIQGVQTKCYNKADSQEYLLNDTDEGIGADGIVSEGESAIVAGSDDQ